VLVLLGDRTAQHISGDGGALFRQEHPRDGVCGERHRSDPATHLDEHAAQLDEPEVGAVERIAQGLPENRVEPVAAGLDLGQPFRLGVVGQDRGRQGSGVVGLGGEGEVHASAPSASQRAGRARRSR
jgi:hypothetical protein